jgi:hypothetical protein
MAGAGVLRAGATSGGAASAGELLHAAANKHNVRILHIKVTILGELSNSTHLATNASFQPAASARRAELAEMHGF